MGRIYKRGKGSERKLKTKGSSILKYGGKTTPPRIASKFNGKANVLEDIIEEVGSHNNGNTSVGYGNQLD